MHPPLQAQQIQQNQQTHYGEETHPAPLSPAMQQVLTNMAKTGRLPFQFLTPEEAKVLYAKGADILEVPSPQMAQETLYQVSALDGSRIAVKLFRPSRVQTVCAKRTKTKLSAALIYFHGGGFTIGSIETHQILCRVLAEGVQMPVLSVDYRLAPKHTFPCAHEDAFEAVRWVYQNAMDLLISDKHIFIAGDSAGGTLSLYCAQKAALEGYQIKGQVLFYPGCSPRQDLNSHKIYSKGYVLEQETIEYFYRLYLKQIEQREDWRFSALCSPHLSLMPETWFGLAQCDPLRDEGVLLHEKLTQLKRPSHLKIYHGVVHGFIKMGRFVDEARQAHKDACDFIREMI
jgi:acetyl esterase